MRVLNWKLRKTVFLLPPFFPTRCRNHHQNPRSRGNSFTVAPLLTTCSATNAAKFSVRFFFHSFQRFKKKIRACIPPEFSFGNRKSRFLKTQVFIKQLSDLREFLIESASLLLFKKSKMYSSPFFLSDHFLVRPSQEAHTTPTHFRRFRISVRYFSFTTFTRIHLSHFC